MAEELTQALAELAERGVPRGAAEVLEDARRAARGTSPIRATWRRNLAVAAGAAAIVLVLIGGVVFLLRPFADEQPGPMITQQPEVVTTIAAEIEGAPDVDGIARRPAELVPTGAHLLTRGTAFSHVVRDGASGLVWAGGTGGLARIDPSGGYPRVWTHTDDEAFGLGISGLAPAGGGGVWMILSDGSLRWFDGDRFRDAVEAPPQTNPGWDLVAAVVERDDGTLLASTWEGGIFRWDGSSWARIDDTRPVSGAGVLALGDDGTLWVGNVEAPGGVRREPRGAGVSRFDGEHWEAFTEESSAVLAGHISSIDVLPDGAVWVSSDLGVAHFDGAVWAEFPAAEMGLPGSGWISLDVGPDGTIWAATGFGANGGVMVASFDGESWSTYGGDEGLPPRTSLRYATPMAGPHGVLVGTGAGLFRLADGRWSAVPLVPEPSSVGTEEAAVPFAGVEGIRSSGGSVWTWGGDEIWRHVGGRWAPFADTPDQVIDVAYAFDSLWAIVWDRDAFSSFELVRFDGAQWESVPLTETPDQLVAGLDGMLWLSAVVDEPEYLKTIRFDGTVWHRIDVPTDDEAGPRLLGEIAVTPDGTLWFGGLDRWEPRVGGFGRYDGSTWEMVHPLGGPEDIPAALVQATPQGRVWALLVDRQAAVWYVHFDGTEWSVVDGASPAALPGVMEVDGAGIWVAQGWGTLSEEGFDGLAHFDGRTWTRYLAGTPVADLAVSPDGTVWYVTYDRALRRLDR